MNHTQFVLHRLVNINPLDAFAISSEMLQWNNDIFINFERIGMRCYGRSTRSVQPELSPPLRASRDKTRPVACYSQLHDGCRGGGQFLFIITCKIRNKHHLRCLPLRTLRCVFHGLDVAFVEVFQTRQNYIRIFINAIPEFNNGGNRLAQICAIEFQAHRMRNFRQRVQNKNTRGDQTIATFLLHTG